MNDNTLTRSQLDKIEEIFYLAQFLKQSDIDSFIVQQTDGNEAMLQILKGMLKTNLSTSTISAPNLQLKRERVDRYRIEREIGEGGFGKVYLASYELHESRICVAIKLLNLSLDKQVAQQLSERFLQERQILASLSHPNIAALIDGGITEDGVLYLVMEYIEGEPIDKYCDGNRLTIEERLVLYLQLCSAVNYVHQRQIVHRDLKPMNILVTDEGVVKLLDFGISKLLGSFSEVPFKANTKPGDRLLTWLYASPEQVAGKDIDIRSDIYSLGVILYELLTGHSPYLFQQRLRDKLDNVISNVVPLPPSEVIELVEEVKDPDGQTIRIISPKQISASRNSSSWRLRHRLMGDVDQIVLKSLEKIPEFRYTTCYSLSEDIGRFLSGLPVKARKSTKLYLLAKLVRRNKFIALLLTTSIGVCIYGGHLYGKRYEIFVNSETKFFLERERLLGLIDDILPETSDKSVPVLKFPSTESDVISINLSLLSEAENLAETCVEWRSIISAYQRLGQYLTRCGNTSLAKQCFQKANKHFHTSAHCL